MASGVDNTVTSDSAMVSDHGCIMHYQLLTIQDQVFVP